MTLAARLAPHLPPRLVSATATLLYPRFEPELRRLSDFCRPGGTAVDVGGWYGPWARHLARRADRVVTLEPVPHLARLLRAVTPDNVEVVVAAAGDRSGTATLWLPPGGRGDRGVSSLVRRRLHRGALEVRCLTLDELELSDVTLIKIDVDGGEPAVLHGAERTVERDRPAVFVELETRIQPLGPVLEWFAARDYRGWVLPGDRWLPLAAFDLPGHQARTSYVAEHGLVRRTLVPHRRYVNSVLFLPRGHGPGDRAYRTNPAATRPLLRDDVRHDPYP
ncbi:FkbM family methyltransferase [Streptomyces olivaceiscleroticus]|uniref:Methyltransferase FkbM domain-containing protein n=1 Tax=Streptomyces olivaceiscleroticus TaxID=68245 RepID=A0ABN0ZST5_9ACTN